MIDDLAVARVAVAGAVAAFLVHLLVRVVREERTRRRTEADRSGSGVRLRRSTRQRALIDDPDITVPPRSGFDVENISDSHTVHNGTA